MSKLTLKKSIILLAVLAFVVIAMPARTSAQEANYYDDGYDHFLAPSQNPIPILYSISPTSARPEDSLNTITITGHGFKPNSIARWNGSSRSTTFIDSDHLIMHLDPNDLRTSGSTNYVNVFNPSRNAYSIAATFKIKGATPGGNANTFNSTKTSQNANQYGSSNNDENVSSLASNAIFGGNSFMPSGLIQWVLFAVVILLVIIIIRKMSGASDKYHNSPLKHS